jgi:hypothetical protein
VVLHSTRESSALQAKNEAAELRDSTLKIQESCIHQASPCENGVISVVNLKGLLEILPNTSEELSTEIDRICETEKIGEPSSVLDLSVVMHQQWMLASSSQHAGLSIARTNKHLMDGRYLDKLYEIDKDTNLKSTAVSTDKQNIVESNPKNCIPVGDMHINNSQLDKQVMLNNQNPCSEQSGSIESLLNTLNDSDRMQSIKGSTIKSTGVFLFCDHGNPEGPPGTSAAPCGGEDRSLPTREHLETIYKYLESYVCMIIFLYLFKYL